MRRALIALIALGCGGGSDDHLARARKLIGSGQWANARTELGQVLGKDAHDASARALLVYCLDREDGLRRAVDVSLHDLHGLAIALDHADWQRVPADVRKVFDTMVTEARKKLFDKTIDTQDAHDLAGVLSGAARYGYEHDDDPERKAADAAVLAADGDPAALAYLVAQLKGEHPEPIVNYLVDVGAHAIDPLRVAIADKSFIGRRAALDALARIQAGARGHALLASHPGLHVIPRSVPGARRLSRVAIGNDPELIVLEAQYVALDGGGDDGLVLLEGWDDRSGAVLAQLFAARDGDLVQLAAPVELGGPSVLYGLAVDHGRAIARRVVETTGLREVDAKVTIAPGLRVRIVGVEPHGEVVRDDAGLWLIKLDQPIQGMSQMSVPASALIALRREPHTDVAIETLSGTIRVDRWDITQRDVTPDPSPETSESSK